MKGAVVTFLGKTAVKGPKGVKPGSTIDEELLGTLSRGQWWQLAAATLFMAVFVTAFSLMTDALRDALDPKLRGLE